MKGSKDGAFRVELAKEFAFEAAHRLPRAPKGHKCRRLHGHSYRVTVVVAGPVDPEKGWLMDYGEISSACGKVVKALDHRTLNKIAGLENPTAEVLSRWLWEQLRGPLAGLSAVTVHETCTAGCTYRG